MSNSQYERELRSEREYVSFLYERLDTELTTATGQLEGSLGELHDEVPEHRWARETMADTWLARVRGLRAAEAGLCFGRIDDQDGGRTYVGRIGLFDEDNGYEPFVMDWRAPAARPFYCATAANPDGVTRRRHFRTDQRDILDFHDDLLDLSDVSTGDTDAALLAAVNAPRRETMRDIVATIQAEQDEIIRLGDTGIVVVDGGPGTGKTAVALHRVAYLLYANRERLSRRGVLIIGPNPRFLRYIGDVLPSLGETDVVFATVGELFPGVRATAVDPPETARVKGSLAMVDALAAAVADRQRVPGRPVPIELEDVTVSLNREVAARARGRARASGLPHNQARAVFRKAVINGLTTRAVRKIGTGWIRGGDATTAVKDLTADVRAELVTHRDLARQIDALWPVLTPGRLLADLLSSRTRLAATGLESSDRDVLYRADGDAWTVSDAPLLDEAAELLGRVPDRTAEIEARRQVEYARGVLEILDTDDDPDGEMLRAVDVVDAEYLVERQTVRDTRALSERAAEDREWTFGHVVVDEAQELSEMDWRVVMRRCPTRSVTVVGDLVQRQSAAGARSWEEKLDRYRTVGMTRRELTINYRTCAEVMDVAGAVLAELDPTLSAPESVRSSGYRPWSRRVGPGELSRAVADAVAEVGGPGTVAVIAPEDLDLDRCEGAVWLTPTECKGLEFDAVIVVEPARIPGRRELYVALTRATQRLGVVHTEPLPGSLAGLAER